MAFQIKNFPSIVAAMINQMRGTQDRVTDFNIGSIARTLVEAPAIEVDELYQQMFIGLREAIPVSIYNAFGFDLLPPVVASGRVEVTITSSPSDTLISAGTVFKIENGKTDYESVNDVTITTGNTVADVLVRARTAGTVGNIPAGQNFTLQPTLSNLVSAINQSAFTNGRDTETEAQRKERFAQFVQTLNRGTVAAIEFGLTTADVTDSEGQVIERVSTASVVEPYTLDPQEPIALVECYLHNGSAPASAALITRANEVIFGYTDEEGEKIPGWKAAGVHVDIFAATEVTVAVTGTLTAEPGYEVADLAAVAINEVTQYLLELPMDPDGSAAIRAEIIAIIMGVEGVYNVDLTLPAADVSATFSEKIMPGTITIT